MILILVILIPLIRYHFNFQTVQINPENEIGIIIPPEDLRCEGLLIDEAIRQNQNAVLTGGFYNLTESDNWKWSDEKEREQYKYENFCKNQTEIIHLAKRKKETFLYIVKDFRFKNLKRNSLENHRNSIYLF